MMTYQQFKELVAEKGWTLEQLRCDVPPTEEILETMERTGLDVWERYVLRLEREQQ